VNKLKKNWSKPKSKKMENEMFGIRVGINSPMAMWEQASADKRRDFPDDARARVPGPGMPSTLPR
jgi:hypothetical protein